jgi:DNA-binding SARP family transcriptional activator
MVEYRMLGVMEVEARGRLLDLGPPKQRLVLAALLLEAGRPVGLSALIDRVWDDEPPPGARDVIYAHISRLRRLLAAMDAEEGTPGRVIRSSGGYLLRVNPDVVDAHRFRTLVGHARRGGVTDDGALCALRRALALWRGVPLADLPGDWATRTREGLVRLWLSAVAGWAALELRRNNPKAVIDELYPVADEHPLQETLAALLIRALHEEGRAAEALRFYARARQHLADELSTGPGTALREAGESILRPLISTPIRR